MQLRKEDIPFTMVANEVLKDPRISFKAKGMYAYLFSKPDTWDFSSNRMTMESTDGRKAIMAVLRELEDAGYLVRNRLSTGKVEYILKHSDNNPKSLNGTQDTKAQVPKRLRAKTSPISNTEVLVIQKHSDVPSQDIQSFIESFKTVNPSYERLFANKTERASASRLIKKFGINKMLSTTKALPEIIDKPYAPKITTPYELEKNLGKLIAFVNQNKNITNNKTKIAFI